MSASEVFLMTPNPPVMPEAAAFTHGWLTAKVSALIAYIVLGAVALKYGTTRAVRLLAFGAALACFAYIVTTAVTKNPLFFL